MDDIEPGNINENDESLMMFSTALKNEDPDIDDSNSEQVGKRKTIHSMSAISINNQRKKQ